MRLGSRAYTEITEGTGVHRENEFCLSSVISVPFHEKAPPIKDEIREGSDKKDSYRHASIRTLGGLV